MKVKILRATVADGSVVNVGDIVDIKPDTAQLLIGLKKAEPVAEKKAGEPAAEKKAKKGEKATAPGGETAALDDKSEG